MQKVKVFGREPVMWVSLIEAALVLLLAFKVPGLTQLDVVNIIAVVSAALGVYVAYVTRDTNLGVVVGLVKACIALAVGYGLPWSEDKTAAAIAVVTVVVGFIHQGRTAPAITPSFRDPTPADEIPVPVETRPLYGDVHITGQLDPTLVDDTTGRPFTGRGGATH